MVNRKGGVGKTTLTLLTAAAMHANGYDVAIDDRDPQRSATILAPNMGLRCGTAAQYVIIDTPPAMDTIELQTVIRDADIVVLITSPSPTDMPTTARSADTITQLRTKKTVVLINKLRANTVLGRQVDNVAKLLPFDRLQNMLPDRQSYQKALLGGWSTLSKNDAGEILGIVLEILA